MAKIYTQKRLADEIGLDPSYFNQIIKGKKSPAWRLARRIATYTNTDPVIWAEDCETNVKQRQIAVLKIQIAKQSESYGLHC